MNDGLMSTPWSVFVITLTALNILICLWLIRWTAKRDDNEAETSGHVWDDDLEELNNPLPKWWLYLFYITIVFGLIYFVLYPGLGTFKGVLGWDQINQYQAEVVHAQKQYGDVYKQFAGQSIDSLRKNPAALKYGQRLFSDNCALCHGSDGRGAPGFPNLSDNDWLYGDSTEQVYQSILNGRTGIMTPFESIVDDQGIEQLAAYVLSLSGKSFSRQLVDPGKEKFAMYCAACHAADGKGKPLLGAPNLTDGIWLHSRRVESIKQTIRKGIKGEMPAHQELLGEDKTRLVTAYVLNLSKE